MVDLTGKKKVNNPGYKILWDEIRELRKEVVAVCGEQKYVKGKVDMLWKFFIYVLTPILIAILSATIYAILYNSHMFI
jgi:hypothetical protein